MSIVVTSVFGMKVVETLGQNTASASSANRRTTHDQFNKSETRDVDSTPSVTECAFFEVTLSSGAATIDLTALTSTNGRALDATGLKLVELLLINENSNAVTISAGASNGYASSNIPFTAAPGIIVPPKGANDAGGRLHLHFASSCPAVSGTVKTLDLAGTGSDVVQIGLVFSA